RGRRSRLRAALEREDRISLCRSLRQSVRNYRGVKWLPVQHRQGRRELSFLIANKKTGRKKLDDGHTNSRPRRWPGFFCSYHTCTQTKAGPRMEAASHKRKR